MIDSGTKTESWKDKKTILHAVILRGDEEHREILVQPANEEGKFTLPIQEVKRFTTLSKEAENKYFFNELGIRDVSLGIQEIASEDKHNRIVYYVAERKLPTDLNGKLKGEWISLEKAINELSESDIQMLAKVLPKTRKKN